MKTQYIPKKLLNDYYRNALIEDFLGEKNTYMKN